MVIFENSPAIYGWVHGSAESPVPSGTKEMVCRPWRDLKIGLPVFPAINGWAIFVDRIEQFFRASAFIPIFPSRGG
jgi:hypothetical protein